MKPRLALILWLIAAPVLPAQTPALEKDAGRSVPGRIGKSAAYTLRSAILGERRRINIATPASFEMSASTRRYPVVIAFDGESLFAPKIFAAQYLADAGQMPEVLLVGVENMGGERGRVHDLTPPGLSVSGSSQQENGESFLDFLEKELVPALERQFRAGRPRVLIGHSSGAVLASYAAAARAQTFPFVLAIDTPAHLQDGWLTARLMEAARKPAPQQVRFVSMEARFGWSDKAWQGLQAAAPAAWKLHREKLNNESHNSMVLLATYLGLRQLFADYSILSAPDSPTSAAIQHYRKLAADYGDAPVPPRPLLTRVVEDFLMEGRAADARSTLDTLMEGYGDFQEATQLRAQIAEAAKLPPLAETVEDLLSAPKPDQKAIAPFLGEWNGTMRYDESPAQPVRLRLELRDGVASGSWISWPGPQTELAMPLQYIKVVEGGLHFGFMNGMRPRGMLMHEAVLRDGQLEGEVHFRGIRFTYPEGMKEPRITFSLRRGE
jgi:predicted alpha/beta superfamily hydrolase